MNVHDVMACQQMTITAKMEQTDIKDNYKANVVRLQMGWFRDRADSYADLTSNI